MAPQSRLLKFEFFFKFLFVVAATIANFFWLRLRICLLSIYFWLQLV